MSTKAKVRSFWNVPIGSDDTDHFWVECPDCGARMNAKGMVLFILDCPMCRGNGHKKKSSDFLMTTPDLLHPAELDLPGVPAGRFDFQSGLYPV